MGNVYNIGFGIQPLRSFRQARVNSTLGELCRVIFKSQISDRKFQIVNFKSQIFVLTSQIANVMSHIS